MKIDFFDKHGLRVLGRIRIIGGQPDKTEFALFGSAVVNKYNRLIMVSDFTVGLSRNKCKNLILKTKKGRNFF